MAVTTQNRARITKAQHTSPCKDCPFRTNATPGWLGGYTPEKLVGLALITDARYDCHTRKESEHRFHQCAGMALFRSNNCKSPRDPEVLQLKSDVRRSVFKSSAEFIKYHRASTFFKNDDPAKILTPWEEVMLMVEAAKKLANKFGARL